MLDELLGKIQCSHEYQVIGAKGGSTLSCILQSVTSLYEQIGDLRIKDINLSLYCPHCQKKTLVSMDEGYSIALQQASKQKDTTCRHQYGLVGIKYSSDRVVTVNNHCTMDNITQIIRDNRLGDPLVIIYCPLCDTEQRLNPGEAGIIMREQELRNGVNCHD